MKCSKRSSQVQNSYDIAVAGSHSLSTLFRSETETPGNKLYAQEEEKQLKKPTIAKQSNQCKGKKSNDKPCIFFM